MLLDYFLYSFLILLILSFIVLCSILCSKRLKKRPEIKPDNLAISSFSSMNFIEVESNPTYSESNSNLGITGRLILDCFTGICQKRDYYYDSDDDLTFDYVDIIDYSCSEQCSYNIKNECECGDPYLKKGTCSRKYDDSYDVGKYCYADNVIYFWKGKKYTILKKDAYTYYNNAILKGEECPKDTINCGIIDDNENQLCIPSTYSCPVNYFSESKLNENKLHSSVMIGNKTFYYTFDDNNKRERKIIAGLIADSDLHLNENNDQKVLLDTGNISEFLIDNKNLYKEVELGFDPYKEDNIDSKGNSYLRLFYNDKVDLSNLRRNIDEYNFNRSLNEDLIKPINKKIKRTSIFGFIASGIFLILCILILLTSKFYNFDDKTLITFICILVIIFLMLSEIYGCLNIKNFNELRDKDRNNNNIARKINIVVVIIGYILLAFNIFVISYIICIRNKLDKCCYNICDKKNKNKNIYNNTTQNAMTTPNNTDIVKNINDEKNSAQNVN